MRNDADPNPASDTPLTPDELSDLIPNLATKHELNEWERENILSAWNWASERRETPQQILTDIFICKLHSKMFDQTWKWAGHYRKSEKNIGVPFYQVREQLGVLVGDVRYWIRHRSYAPDEIAVRFHHRLVAIHPFPNGNGRHARMIADLLIKRLGQRTFSWGLRELVQAGELRKKYVAALKAADAGDIKPLLEFARS